MSGSVDAPQGAAVVPPPSGAAAPAPPPGWRPPLAWAAVFLLVAGLIQLFTPAPWDADTAYHVAVGRLLAEHGVLRAFPWTPFSWLAENYADKELLFHLLLAPLSSLDWITASKLAGAALGALVLLVTYLVLRAEGVARAGVWALVPLAASGAYAYRFALVRPHLLSIALALAVTWAALRGRTWLLLALCALYPWSYIAWHLPLVLVAVIEVARLAGGGRLRAAPWAAALAGVAIGVALHPNAANLLRFWWLVHVDILARTAWGARQGFELGTEFQPFAPADFVRLAALPVVMALAALVMGWRARARDPGVLAFALAAAAFAGLTVLTQRFVEYLAPFGVVALALALRDRARTWAAGALAGAFAFTAAFGAGPVLRLGLRANDIPPIVVDYLQARVPPGAQVFTCDWGLTGELMIALPDRKFLVALDPVLMYARDPAAYREWRTITREGPPDARERILRGFGARHVLCFASPAWKPLFARLRSDPRVATRLESRLWYLYDLDPPAAPGP